MIARTEAEFDADSPLIRATLRMNALIFGVILGLMTGLMLFALALAAGIPALAPTRLPVMLLGVFVPGYAAGFPGALAGFFWGCVAGGLLGGGVYWINYRALLSSLDRLVEIERRNADFPVAALRLHGPSLGLALGAMGAAGLVVATNWLVVRGTAAESFHARLLAQVLPGYEVNLAGSLAGAASLFLILFVFCIAFAQIYNRLVAARHRHAGEPPGAEGTPAGGA
jgi:hypothetical protein